MPALLYTDAPLRAHQIQPLLDLVGGPVFEVLGLDGEHSPRRSLQEGGRPVDRTIPGRHGLQEEQLREAGVRVGVVELRIGELPHQLQLAGRYVPLADER